MAIIKLARAKLSTEMPSEHRKKKPKSMKNCREMLENVGKGWKAAEKVEGVRKRWKMM